LLIKGTDTPKEPLNKHKYIGKHYNILHKIYSEYMFIN